MSENELHEASEDFSEVPLAAREVFNEGFIQQFRANGGAVTEGPIAGVPALLLHTVGAKSGEARVSPLYRLDFADKWHVVGSFGGSAKAPAWVHNLRENPKMKVEVGSGPGGEVRTYEVTARELPATERDQAWAALVQDAVLRRVPAQDRTADPYLRASARMT